MLCVIPVTVINVKTNQNVLKKKYFKRKKEKESVGNVHIKEDLKTRVEALVRNE